ncbi:hypothetical protein Zmor_014277 [Zophobas morio]|uniref:Uncharacterized protein n=1 Tax=Zophobas morio TaxID=2755281 RepID=A0AA38IKK3_9CUCU|nr:hypothetical protein Zmor_014277 [Zophobas morio]
MAKHQSVITILYKLKVSGDGSQSDNETCGEINSDHEEQEEKEKTDQSQQTTPTTPPNDPDSPNSQRYILETITMTTVTEQRILREVEDERKTPTLSVAPGGSPINGILKGGKLWKQQSVEMSVSKPPEPQQTTESSVASDEEGSSRRSVRFIESEQNKRDSCDGAPDNSTDENTKTENSNSQPKQSENCNSSVSPESTEMMLTFKLGNHVLISNNSLKPNSAVRQLFPCTKQLNGKAEDESIHQYLVTAESLRAFEEAKRSKLPQIIQSGETDESIKRAIERNTLRRSLIRYEPRSKKNVQKTDNSLVERIKQLTCDVDDINQTEEIPFRASPPGEEARNSPEVNQSICKNSDKSFSPSSSSTASSNSSSMSSTYKKITDLFGKREKMTDAQTNIPNEPKLTPLPDLGNGSSHIHEVAEASHNIVSKTNSTNEPRKQFLSTLAPLTACVSSLGNADEYYYQMNNHVGERSSVASSVGTEYSLEDIDEGLKNLDEESKKIAPDVLAGTPSASESGDELAMFVQQDASRIERIKKKYLPEQPNREDDDDEHDDYGFNRRPSVRGIKPRFGSTTEILQQIQNQLQPPAPTARVAWPYYSESGLTGVDNSKSRNINQNMPNYQYPNVPEEVKTRNIPPQYRPTSLQDENIYQNCTNQRCVREVYRANGNQTYSSFMKVGSTCTEYYQSLPRTRNGRPQSPPPLELSKNYHQTMVYIPYNHIEGYQHNPYYQSNDYVRVSNQNQINKRYIEPVYQQRIHSSHVDEHHYASNMLPPIPLKPIVRIPLSQQPHLMTSRSESPVPGQFSTARSTQTPLATASTCSYYAANPRYRPMVGPAWPTDCNYVAKVNRHSFPAAVPRYPPPDSISLTDSDSQHSGQMPNGYRQSMDVSFTQKDSLPNSPTKPRFLERGVPEGAAASAPSLDTTNSQSSRDSEEKLVDSWYYLNSENLFGNLREGTGPSTFRYACFEESDPQTGVRKENHF